MGYMDISIEGSDLAAQAASDAFDAIAKSLKKSLRETGNEFNTSGAVNVALFFENCIKGQGSVAGEPLYNLARECVVKLDEEIRDAKDKETWGDENNRLMHLNCYRRLRRSLCRFIKQYEDNEL